MNLRLLTLLTILPFLLLVCNKNPTEPPTEDTEERILFIRNTPDFSEICTVLPDGSDIRVIARYEYGDDYYWQGYFSAKWSSDKTRLVVEGGPGSTKDVTPLWLMDSNGDLVEQIAWDGNRPLWAKGDQSIIFAHRRGYFSRLNDIYGLNLSTGAVETLVWAETGAQDTEWGYNYLLGDIFPNDNSRLLLGETYMYEDSSGSWSVEDPEIIIYDVSNQQKTYLTNNDTEDEWAKISPSGNFIAFTIKNPGVYPFSNNLYLMTIDGNDTRQLSTGTTSMYTHILWSPDGRSLVFKQADQSGGYNYYGDLFILDIQSGVIDTLLVREEEEMSYRPVDWK